MVGMAGVEPARKCSIDTRLNPFGFIPHDKTIFQRAKLVCWKGLEPPYSSYPINDGLEDRWDTSTTKTIQNWWDRLELNQLLLGFNQTRRPLTQLSHIGEDKEN